MTKQVRTGIAKIIDQAIYEELRAAQLYRHLSNQCQRIGLFGAAKYFLKESMEELEHYQKWADYLNDRGDVALLPQTPAFETSISSMKDAIKAAFEAEKSLDDKYIDWYSQVCKVDPTTAGFMLFYLEKQRVSVGFYADLYKRLDLGGDIYVFDQELRDK